MHDNEDNEYILAGTPNWYVTPYWKKGLMLYGDSAAPGQKVQSDLRDTINVRYFIK